MVAFFKTLKNWSGPRLRSDEQPASLLPILEQSLQVCRQWCGDGAVTAGLWVLKLGGGTVECLAGEQQTAVFGANRFIVDAVPFIGHNGMADGGQMDSQLVGAPGFGGELDE